MKEHIKTVLILLLGGSALFLLSRTWVYDMEPEPAGQPENWAPVRQDYREIAVVPSRCAVMSGGLRRGAQYNETASALFQSFSPFLTEALNKAETPRLLNEEQWREALERDGVYFEYTGSYPMPLIAASLSADSPEGGDVTAIGLSFADGGTELFWREADGSMHSAAAGPEMKDRPELPEMNPCDFGFERADLPTVSPWLLLIHELSDPRLYNHFRIETPPDIEVDLESYTPFMEALEMPPLSTSFYRRWGDARVYIDVDGDRSCKIASDGTILYTAAVQESARVYTQSGGPSLAGAVFRAKEIVSTLTQAMGAARFEIQHVEQTGGRIKISFMVTVGGIPFHHEPANVIIEDDVISSISLKLCRLAEDSASARPLSQVHAAVLFSEDERLGLCYRDGGDGIASVEWVAVE